MIMRQAYDITRIWRIGSQKGGLQPRTEQPQAAAILPRARATDYAVDQGFYGKFRWAVQSLRGSHLQSLHYPGNQKEECSNG